ncbi:MAG: dicarboxylate/amino acid:cation symporter [Armatimonadetes bacterium]|nr:dicarboxylate/amino acid:cation symporter [Armatimonadota bacterium]
MSADTDLPHDTALGRGGFFQRWHETPLYLRIVAALVLGVIVGVVMGPSAAPLRIPSKLILQLLGALAPPLILIAVIQALMKARIQSRMGAKMAGLLILNTLVAIFIGLLVANIIQPGRWAQLSPPAPEQSAAAAAAPGEVDVFAQFLENIPRSLLGPLGDNGKIIGVIFIAIAFGIALRRSKDHPIRTVEDVVDVGFNTLLVILHWIIDLIPIGVFGIVAGIVGEEGFAPFLAMGAFILSVLLALLLQATYYLVRIRIWSWVSPFHLLRETRDALVMAFSTASSTITMPVTYERLRERVKLREESASLGALVGANFNNDGTALYEAMAALFISQMIGVNLTLEQQLMVVLTSVIASVGAAGIPEAGLVTMTLVFRSVGLPVQYIALLLTVDWFLDRCRTAINVMGDMNVSCLLDGKTPEEPVEAKAA